MRMPLSLSHFIWQTVAFCLATYNRIKIEDLSQPRPGDTSVAKL